MDNRRKYTRLIGYTEADSFYLQNTALQTDNCVWVPSNELFDALPPYVTENVIKVVMDADGEVFNRTATELLCVSNCPAALTIWGMDREGRLYRGCYASYQAILEKQFVMSERVLGQFRISADIFIEKVKRDL